MKKITVRRTGPLRLTSVATAAYGSADCNPIWIAAS